MATPPVPGIDEAAADKVTSLLGDRLASLLDLHLTLKHVHWNVTGPTFIGVHEMLDEHTVAVRTMSDDVAERIATLGGVPEGTPGAIVRRRRWDDYGVGRASVRTHMEALDSVYHGVISDHRSAIDETAELDPVTEDLLVGQAKQLELYHWFVRSHLAEGDN